MKFIYSEDVYHTMFGIEYKVPSINYSHSGAHINYWKCVDCTENVWMCCTKATVMY